MEEFDVPDAANGIPQLYLADGKDADHVAKTVNDQLRALAQQNAHIQSIRVSLEAGGQTEVIIFYMLPLD